MKMTKKEFRERVLRDKKRKKAEERQAMRKVEGYFFDKIRRNWNIRQKLKRK